MDRDLGHGRIECRRIGRSGDIANCSLSLDCPKTRFLARVTSDAHFKKTGKWRKTETVYRITNLLPEQATCERLPALNGGYSELESRLHYVKDVAVRKDTSRMRIRTFRRRQQMHPPRLDVRLHRVPRARRVAAPRVDPQLASRHQRRQEIHVLEQRPQEVVHPVVHPLLHALAGAHQPHSLIQVTRQISAARRRLPRVGPTRSPRGRVPGASEATWPARR